MNLYNVLSNRYVGMSNFERLFAQKFGGSSGEVKEIEGIPPITFTANGRPLLDYLISGNTVQTGTPTPENPILPSGCGDISNLCDITPFIINANAGSQQKSLTEVNLLAGTYTFSCKQKNSLTSATRNCIFVRFDGTNRYESTLENYHLEAGIHSLTFTILSNTTVTLGYWTHSLDTNCEYSDFMLNTEETPLPYEPYGYKLPLTSAGQGVDIYLGEVQSTRRIKKLVLTGEENWKKRTYGDANYSYEYGPGFIVRTGLCSHYARLSAQSIDKVDGIYLDQTAALIVTDLRFTTTTDFKSFLAAQYAAGTPVTVWYVLAEPETAVVNEPLMKIGDYADTISKEQAGVSIPTNKGSTTFDVNTTVPPSNVYIKYKG